MTVTNASSARRHAAAPASVNSERAALRGRRHKHTTVDPGLARAASQLLDTAPGVRHAATSGLAASKSAHPAKLERRIQNRYHDMVGNLDSLRRAVRSGNDSAAGGEFRKAQKAFREIVAAGNDLRVDMRTGNKHDDALRSRAGATVRNAYAIAQAVEQAMPGNAKI